MFFFSLLFFVLRWLCISQSCRSTSRGRCASNFPEICSPSLTDLFFLVWTCKGIWRKLFSGKSLLRRISQCFRSNKNKCPDNFLRSLQLIHSLYFLLFSHWLLVETLISCAAVVLWASVYAYTFENSFPSSHSFSLLSTLWLFSYSSPLDVILLLLISLSIQFNLWVWICGVCSHARSVGTCVWEDCVRRGIHTNLSLISFSHSCSISHSIHLLPGW